MMFYRVRCSSTKSGWAWDITSLTFYSNNRPVSGLHGFIDSGNAGDAWAPQNAFTKSNQPWGGRADQTGDFWIGGQFNFDPKINSVQITETSAHHRANDPKGIVLEMKVEGSGNDWKPIITSTQSTSQSHAAVPSAKDEHTTTNTEITWEASGQIPKYDDLTTTPSLPLSGKVHGCCYKSNVHPRRTEVFVPDENFYHAEYCEGLWVCVSKACGEETLQRACQLIRSTVPIEQRKMWDKFQSPKWAKDPGPMRIIVLDDRTNEQAGCIPELQDESTGRNQTSCPFIFTSREDFFGGVGGGGQSWCEGRLTLHELTHGSDMVIRQLKDPYFHEEVGKLWSKYRDKFKYDADSTKRKITIYDSGECIVEEEEKSTYCYAATNRDEFLAECHCIAQGLHVKSMDYTKCNMSTPDELRCAMPDVYQLLERNFLMAQSIQFSKSK